MSEDTKSAPADVNKGLAKFFCAVSNKYNIDPELMVSVILAAMKFSNATMRGNVSREDAEREFLNTDALHTQPITVISVLRRFSIPLVFAAGAIGGFFWGRLS